MEETKRIEVLKAIAEVQKRFASVGVAKERKANAGIAYAFRGVDDIVQTMAPWLKECGLVIVPRVVERIQEMHKTSKGTDMTRVVIRADYAMYSTVDGSVTFATTWGEAFDTSDKATNKAMTAAYKYMLIETFHIPLAGVEDIEEQNHQPTGHVPSRTDKDLYNDAIAILHNGAKSGWNGLIAAWKAVSDMGLSQEMKEKVAKVKDKLKAQLDAEKTNA